MFDSSILDVDLSTGGFYLVIVSDFKLVTAVRTPFFSSNG